MAEHLNELISTAFDKRQKNRRLNSGNKGKFSPGFSKGKPIRKVVTRII